MTRGNRIPFYLAWKYLLRSNKWTLLLIIFFMSIAFINMIFVSSLFNGVIEGFNKQIIDTSTGHLLITPSAGQDTLKDTSKLLDLIRNTDGVTAASAETSVSGILKFGDSKGTWRISAIQPDDESRVTIVSQKMISGNYLSSNDTDGIILGRDIAGITDDAKQSRNPFVLDEVRVGDIVTLDTGYAQYDLTVRGIFYAKFVDTDSSAFITEKTYKKINPLFNGDATKIIVRINQTGNEQSVIGEMRNEGITENIYSWQDASSLMDSISSSFTSINIILSIVGVLIAAITVFIVIYIDITSKKKQIGIMRAIGIRPYLIHTTYVLQTVIYSVSGVLLGSLIYFFAIIPYFKAHPFELPIADVTLSIGAVEFIGRLETLIIVALISGLIPALHITRVKILDAIWGR